MENNLALVETDALINELKSRYDFMVFMGRKITGPGLWQVKRRVHGDEFVCLGLCDNLKTYINRTIWDSEIPNDGKDR